jgi:hypothetical protein
MEDNMTKRSRILSSIVVAAVFLSANPAYAQHWWQPLYQYTYYENGLQVGLAFDLCTESGVVTLGDWVSGYQTSDVHVGRIADCVDGRWTHL